MGCDAAGAPMITVLMTTLNNEDTIAEALDSVVDEWPNRAEIVLVDDGCTDGTIDIARRYRQVTVVPNSGLGIVDALNTGLAAASNEIVARLDSDDFYHPGGLARLVSTIEGDPDLMLVAGAMTLFDEEGRDLGLMMVMREPDQLRLVAMSGCPIGHSAVVYRRSRVVELGGYRKRPNTRVAEDYDLWIRMLTAGDDLVGISEVVCAIRVTARSISSTRRAHQMSDVRSLAAGARRTWGNRFTIRKIRSLAPREPDQRERYLYSVVALIWLALGEGSLRLALRATVAALLLGPIGVVTAAVRMRVLLRGVRLGRGLT